MEHECTRCKVVQPLANFFRNGPTYKWVCRECIKAYQLQRRIDIIRWVYDYLLDHPCLDCGCNNPVVMEFDHRDPDAKAIEVSKAIANNCGLDTIQAEIAKCDPVCANCHRKRTAKKQSWYSLGEVT